MGAMARRSLRQVGQLRRSVDDIERIKWPSRRQEGVGIQEVGSAHSVNDNRAEFEDARAEAAEKTPRLNPFSPVRRVSCGRLLRGLVGLRGSTQTPRGC